ncbi:MAG: STAS domain-containing protein [Planctomycetota bacterium]
MIQLTTQPTDTGTEVAVRGEVDLESSPELWQDLQRFITQGKTLRINLSGVPYMDSTGVAVLVRALKQSQSVKGQLVLANPSPRVQAVLDLARLAQLFTIETDAD